MYDTGSRRGAVALGYDRKKDRAPKVLAKGRGALEEKILEVAKAHGIPLQEDPVLVELLAKVEIDQEIPPILYQAVAEVLAFIYKLKGKKG
jgi:flagellar biosynthesis protein